MMAAFPVDKAILAGSEPIAALKLCEARLQNDARWPWIILIPRKNGAREMEHLAPADRAQLSDEISAAAAAVRAIGAALGRPVEVINTAKIGNVTPQLHIHVTGRRPDDAAWPAPAWGLPNAEAYVAAVLAAALEAARNALQGVSLKD